VTPLEALYQALPISSERIRVGNQTSCGGIAGAHLDLAAASVYEFVDATVATLRPEHREDHGLRDLCVTNVRAGIEAELTELFGELPSVRVVLNWVLMHEVDSNEPVNRRAGRTVVRQALRDAGLAVPSADNSYRILHPLT